MKLGIRGKLFLVTAGLILLAVVVSDLSFRPRLDALLTERIRSELLVRLGLIARELSHNAQPLVPAMTWDELANALGTRAQARVTIIRRDGVVLGDSGVTEDALAHLENHAHRPEVVAALTEGRGHDVRLSTTLDQRMLYAAVPFHRSGEIVGAVRLAMPLIEVDQSTRQFQRLLLFGSVIALAVALLVTGITTHLASRTIHRLINVARAMAGGDLSVRSRPTGEGEFSELGRTLDQLAASLSQSLRTLKEERDLLGAILAGMEEGVLVVDPAAEIVMVNNALRRMFLLPADVAGKPVSEAIRHVQLGEVLENASASKGRASGEIDVFGIKPRRLLVHATPVPAQPGNVLAVFVDVTDMRHLESLRRDFVANVSHELRTPVTAIRSALETLQAAITSDPAAAEKFLAIVARHAERLYQLIEDLLDLSRFESRELALTLEPITLGSLVSQVQELFAERAGRRAIALIAIIPADLPPVRADRHALEQVLVNLVDNAMRYCPDGVEIRIRATCDGLKVRLAVEDNGPGIAAKHLPRLFERFYRVAKGRSRDLGGTGLGLAIVKHLVSAMGGIVSVDSTLGKGTTFSFTLPLSKP